MDIAQLSGNIGTVGYGLAAIGPGIGIGIVVYSVLIYFLKIEEIDLLVGNIKARLGKSDKEA